MKILMLLVLVAPLAACEQADREATVAELMADTQRLYQLRRTCKEEPARVTERLCRTANEATLRRYFGIGMAPIESFSLAPTYEQSEALEDRHE